MNGVLQQIADVSADLVSWWNENPKARQDFEKERPRRENNLLDKRERLVSELSAARTAETEDRELEAMVAERSAFMENAPKVNRTSWIREGSDANTIERMDRAIKARQRTHRDKVAKLKKTLAETAPIWHQDAIATFCANLSALEASVRALNNQRIDEKVGYDVRNGNERIIKVKDFAEFRVSMLGSPAGGWLGDAGTQARRLLLEAIGTPEELRARLEAIRKTQPAQRATWRNV